MWLQFIGYKGGVRELRRVEMSGLHEVGPGEGEGQEGQDGDDSQGGGGGPGLAGEDGEVFTGAPLSHHPPPGRQGGLQAGVGTGQPLRTAPGGRGAGGGTLGRVTAAQQHLHPAVVQLRSGQVFLIIIRSGQVRSFS